LIDRTMSFRALKAGDAFDTDCKLQRRYDVEEQLGTQQRLMDWILKVVGATNNVPSGGQYDWKSMSTFLKDGVVLCKLINALLKSIGMPPIKYRPKVPTHFVAMSNIETFMSAAKQYGVTETSLFQTGDLSDGRKGPLINVINCLNVLGKLANARGFQPKYDFVPPPKQDYGLAD